VLREVLVGSRPNGLAWDTLGKHLLVADVQEIQARLVDPQAGQVIATEDLPGRPRWAVYHHAGNRFLVNIREPACVVILAAESFTQVGQFPILDSGPHGLDLDGEGLRAFVACDGGSVVTLDLSNGQAMARVPIAGMPDAIWHNHLLDRLYVFLPSCRIAVYEESEA
jgi:DNA-binding beta-propeller fold protein YncE